MASLSSLAEKCESVFSSLVPLQQRLKGIQNSRSIFAVENGIEYCINAGIEQKLIDAANKNKRLSTGRVPQDVSALDQILSNCAEYLGNCDHAAVEAAKTSSWTPALEKEVLGNWRMFCLHILDVAEILPIVGLDFMLLVGKPGNPETAESERPEGLPNSDKDDRSATGSRSSWHSVGSLRRLVLRKKESNLAKQLAVVTNGRQRLQKPLRSVPSESEIDSSPRPGTPPDIKKVPFWPTPPPSYADNDYGKAPYKQEWPDLDESPTLAYDQQKSLDRFSTTLDSFRNPQSSQGQIFMAEHIHMYHGQPPPLPGPPYPIAGPPNYLPHHAFPAIDQPLYNWQPSYQAMLPPPGPPMMMPPPSAPLMMMPPLLPLSYKSSRLSLRETIATELLDVMKPGATCFHGIRHYKGHAQCAWGCCLQRGCFR